MRKPEEEPVSKFYSDMSAEDSDTAYPDVSSVNGKTVLMCCRPKDTFHLGNLYMLNYLTRCLASGAHVVVLIIPFDEGGQSIEEKESQDRDVRTTKHFIERYLGHQGSPNLMVTSCDEREIDPELKESCRSAWVELVDSHKESEGHPIHKLVRRKGRVWAASSLPFVAKCVASISSFDPDYLAFGKKHEDIYLCFKEVMAAVGCGGKVMSFLIPDFMDIANENPMDRQDSVQTYVNVTDSIYTISCKCSMVSLDGGDKLRSWFDCFEESILMAGPEAYLTEDVRYAHGVARDAPDELRPRIDLLATYLRAVEKDLPQRGRTAEGKMSDFDIRWKGGLDVSEDEKAIVEKLLRSMYVEISSGQFYITRKYSNGFSGMTVLGAKYRLEGRVINSVVLKLGDSLSVEREYENYDKHIKWRKTFAFVDVTRPSLSYMGKEMVAYVDVTRWIGANPKEGVESLYAHIESEGKLKRGFFKALYELFSGNLEAVLYSSGAREYRDCPAGEHYRSMLPLKAMFNADTFDGDTFSLSSCDDDSVECVDGVIFEVKGRQARIVGSDGARYSVDLSSNDAVLRQCGRMIGKEVRVCAPAFSRDAELYERAYSKLGLNAADADIEVFCRKVPNPLLSIDAVLAADYSMFKVATIHGDLHLDNVLWRDNRYAIIDYGSIQEGAPIAFDAATMVAYIIVRLGPLALHEKGDVLKLVERCLVKGKSAPNNSSGNTRKLASLLAFFSYRSSGKGEHLDVITGWCSEDFYWATLYVRLVSMLKFSDWEADQMRLAIGAAGVILSFIRGKRSDS